MQFKNPCKNCLVQPMCKKICHKRAVYPEALIKLKDLAVCVSTIVIGINLCIWLFFDVMSTNIRALTSSIYVTLLLISFFVQLITTRLHRKAIEYNNIRFNERPTFHTIKNRRKQKRRLIKWNNSSS